MYTQQNPKIVVKCTECLKELQISKIALARALKKRGKYVCLQCVMSSNEVRHKIKLFNKNMSKETRNKIRESLKKKYADASDAEIEVIRQKSLQIWEDSEFTRKQKSMRDSSEFRSKLSESVKLAFSKCDWPARQPVVAKKLWQDKDYRRKQLLFKASDSYREKQSRITKAKWGTVEYRKSQSKGLSEAFKKGVDSYIERAVHNILTDMNMSYIRHHVIGWYEFDVYIPDHKLLIECQGEYWHSLDKHKANDIRKYNYVNDYFPDHKILYLYERDFLNPQIVKQKLISSLVDNSNRLIELSQTCFQLNNIVTKVLATKLKQKHSHYSEPEEFMQAYHYAGYGRTAKKLYGAYLDEKLIAVCKFAGVIRKEVATSMNFEPNQVLELDRFCIHPQYHKKNFGSWFISRCSKLLLNECTKIDCLVSFADTTFGHHGTIYSAAGWKMIHTVKPDYHYVSEDGFVLHKKTLYNHARRMGKTESKYANEFRYTKIFGKEKIKFALYRRCIV